MYILVQNLAARGLILSTISSSRRFYKMKFVRPSNICSKLTSKLGLGRILNFATGSGSGYYPAAKNRIRISGNFCRIPDFFSLEAQARQKCHETFKESVWKEILFVVVFFSGRIKIESCFFYFQFCMKQARFMPNIRKMPDIGKITGFRISCFNFARSGLEPDIRKRQYPAPDIRLSGYPAQPH